MFYGDGSIAQESQVTVRRSREISCWLVDPEQVDIPEELAAVLSQDEEGLKIWKAFTPGEQRGPCHYVNSVKNVDSRIKGFEIVGKQAASFTCKAKQKSPDGSVHDTTHSCIFIVCLPKHSA